jgi:hypothetical protein
MAACRRPAGLAISAKNGAAGFSQLKRWPDSFDEVALDLLGASTRGDLEIGDVITRSMAVAGLMTSIDRLPSAEARDVVKSRLMELLGLNFPDDVRDVMEQVQPLRITASVHDRR